MTWGRWILLFGVFLALSQRIAKSNDRYQGRIEKVEALHFENLHRLNKDLYRSEQPTKEGMKELEELGIKTVFNLRNRMNDNREAKGTKLNLLRLRVNAWKMDYADLVNALAMMHKAEKPLVVHCLHGSDRTGAVIAAYRMLVDGWTKEMAIREFRAPEFGYHEQWFPNILSLIEDLDLEQLKKDIGLKINQK